MPNIYDDIFSNNLEDSTLAGNNYDEIFKVANELQNSLKLNEDIELTYKTTTETMQKFAGSLKDVHDPHEVATKVLKSGLILVEETRNMRRMLANIDAKKLSGISEQLKSLSLSDIQRLSKSLGQFAGIDYLVKYKNLSMVCEISDFTRLLKIMKVFLSRIDGPQALSVDEISKEVAERYIEEELAEQAQTDGKDSNVQDSQADQRQVKKDIKDIKDIKDTISFWAGIISLLLTICGFINSKPTVVNNTYNNITEVNYNYTIDVGINAEILNGLGYRIINQNNVMPRIKPDCSSTVIGHLYIGQVVNVTDKRKKWIEITWKNDSGEYCSGWIQNYKVSEFR